MSLLDLRESDLGPAEIRLIQDQVFRIRLIVTKLLQFARPAEYAGYLEPIRLDQVVHLDETSLLCHVQAGLTGSGLERVLTPRGLSLGDYPPSLLGSTLGGLIAAAAGRVPARGEIIRLADQGLEFEIVDADPRRITRVRIRLFESGSGNVAATTETRVPGQDSAR